MGLAITSTEFSPADYARFSEKLQNNLKCLAQVLQTPDFGGQTRSMGAEVELYIIDRHAKPYALNNTLLAEANIDQLTLELNQYNIEYNFTPTPCDATPFSRLEQEWCQTFDALTRCAEQHDARLMSIGILPTLNRSDLGPQVITPAARYQALSEQLLKQRAQRPFEILLNGPDPLEFHCKDVSPEGANASFQFHYRSPADTWVDHYNAAQLVTPLVLAVSGNSPFFLGHRLWHETRVGLFKQSVDARKPEQHLRHEPARVSFGQGWVRQSIYEVFAQSVALYTPLLPICCEQSNTYLGDHTPETNQAPQLHELRLHHGCIWPWNRAIYDPAEGGHIRLELRALPSGPTAVDMLANAALTVGLIEGLRPQLAELLTSLPFKLVEANFYRAAQSGLNTTLLWPDPKQNSPIAPPVPVSAVALLKQLLPIADQGLAHIGIAETERSKYLQIIEGRIAAQQTGALWQLNRYQTLCKKHSKDAALAHLVEDYYKLSRQNTPVHLWPH